MIRSILLMIATHTTLTAADLRVVPGEHGERLYPTVQEAVDAAKPGDIIRIAGGIYFETVTISTSGTPTQPITICPEKNQPVVFNAGEMLTPAEWKQGKDGVWQAKVSRASIPSGVWEMPARVKLASVHSAAQVARRLGSWHFEAIDDNSGILSVRSTRSAPPKDFSLWLEHPDAAAITVKGSHLHLSDLSATLGKHGFLVLPKTTNVTIENCRAYCNSEAGIHLSGSQHVIAHNETYLNNTYGIQLRHEMEGNSILYNRCYFNGPNNGERSGNSVATDLGIYGKGHYNLFEGNLMDGLHEETFRNKGGENPTNLFRNNVLRGSFTTGFYGVEGNTFIVSGLGMRIGMFRNGGGPAPQRSWEKVDPSGELRRANLIYPLAEEADPQFADPAYRDFRLSQGSPYRSKGALAHAGTVAWVDPQSGSDEHDGLSFDRPMKTVAHALSRLPASATLYLMPGIYQEPITIRTGGRTRNEPFRIRAYGKSDQVILRGGIEVEEAQYLVLEHLRFENCGIVVRGSRGVEIYRTVFAGKESGVRLEKSEGTRIERCSLRTIEAIESPATRLTHCVWTSEPEIKADAKSGVYAAFNARQGEAVTADDDFAPIGPKEASLSSELQLINAEVRGLSPTTASLLWNTATIAEAEVELRNAAGKTLRKWKPELIYEVFGEAFDMRRPMEALYSSDRHVGITGLTPGERYQVSITQITSTGERSPSEQLTFTTPTEQRKGAIHYISTEGSDAHDGSAGKPWQTFAHALNQLAPGDELVVKPGIYREILRPRISGSAEQKIRIRSEVPHQAVIDLEQTLPVAVELLSVHHLEVEGFRIRGGKFPYSVAYLLLDAADCAVRSTRLDYPEGSDFEKLKLGYCAGILAHLAPDLVVEDNLFLCAITGVSLSHSPRSRVEHNTFVGEGNYGVAMISGNAKEPYTIRRNLFYRTILGYKSNPAIWGFGHSPELHSDENLFYLPEQHKGTIGALPGLERQPLAGWQEATGQDRNSRLAEPRFVDPEGGDFRLVKGSVGNEETLTGMRD